MKEKTELRLVPDYHVHTVLCKHALGGLKDYRRIARERQIPQICMADHAPNPHGYDTSFRMEMSEFSVYRSMVNSKQNEVPPVILFGIEADYYEGCEEFLRTWLPQHGFDFILGSVHYIDDWGFHDSQQRHIWDSVDITAVWRKYFALVKKLVDLRLFDAVAHLDLPKSFGHRPSDKALKEMIQPILDRIALADMGIELNTKGLRKPVGEIYPSAPVLSMARERGIPVCFGSDAHRPEEVGAGFEVALELAREVGYRNYFEVNLGIKKIVDLPKP